MGKAARSGSRVGAWCPQSLWPVAATVMLMLCVLVSESGGGDGRSGIVPSLAGPDIGAVVPAAGVSTAYPNSISPGRGQLSELLAVELSRRGIDPKKTVSAAPSGEANRVFDLLARLVEPEFPDSGEPVSVELTWTEVLIGDYNQDDVVKPWRLSTQLQNIIST